VAAATHMPVASARLRLLAWPRHHHRRPGIVPRRAEGALHLHRPGRLREN